MKKRILSEWLVLAAIIAYNILFWSEKMGLNTLLFAVLIAGILWYRYPESRHSRAVQWVTAGTLFSAICVVVNNSDFSKVVHFLSMLTMGICWQFPFLRFLWYVLLMGPSLAQSMFSQTAPALVRVCDPSRTVIRSLLPSIGCA